MDAACTVQFMILGMAMVTMTDVVVHVWHMSSTEVEQRTIHSESALGKLVLQGCVAVGSIFIGSIEQPILLGRSILQLAADAVQSMPLLPDSQLSVIGSTVAGTFGNRLTMFVRKADKETLWKNLFQDPKSWRDYRSKKARDELSPNFPDF